MDKKIYYDYFYENILPVIKPMEKERVKKLQKILLTSILCFILGGVCCFIFFYFLINDEFNPIICPITLFFMYVFFLKSIIVIIVGQKEYDKTFRSKIIPLFLKPVANFTQWPKNQNIETVIESKLFSNFDTQEDDVSYFGHFKNTNIIISQTKLTLPVKSSVKTNLFKGITIQLEFDRLKSINNHVIMVSKNERVCNKYKYLKTNVTELNKYLYTFAKNHEHTEFITEEFWTVVKKMGELYRAKGFLLSFKDNILLIASSRKKPLQFGNLFTSLLKAENYDILIERLLIIFELIEVLSL